MAVGARRPDRGVARDQRARARRRPVELVDLGEHRLRDLARPSACSRSCIRSFAASSRRLRSLDAFPTNLPLQLTTFVGRDDERRRRRSPRCGTAASSRSPASVASARPGSRCRSAPRCCRSYRDGAWLCELGPLGDPDARARRGRHRARRAAAARAVASTESVVGFAAVDASFSSCSTTASTSSTPPRSSSTRSLRRARA